MLLTPELIHKHGAPYKPTYNPKLFTCFKKRKKKAKNARQLVVDNAAPANWCQKIADFTCLSIVPHVSAPPTPYVLPYTHLHMCMYTSWNLTAPVLSANHIYRYNYVWTKRLVFGTNIICCHCFYLGISIFFHPHIHTLILVYGIHICVCTWSRAHLNYAWRLVVNAFRCRLKWLLSLIVRCSLCCCFYCYHSVIASKWWRDRSTCRKIAQLQYVRATVRLNMALDF